MGQGYVNKSLDQIDSVSIKPIIIRTQLLETCLNDYDHLLLTRNSQYELYEPISIGFMV